MAERNGDMAKVEDSRSLKKGRVSDDFRTKNHQEQCEKCRFIYQQ